MLMTSCEVEFSPNAEWKNVPVVYAILDQDDDTTWVRVQRCYLSDGNIYQYGSHSDSINYPQGSISVALLAYGDGALKDSIAFTYTERDRDAGAFAYKSSVALKNSRNRTSKLPGSHAFWSDAARSLTTTRPPATANPAIRRSAMSRNSSTGSSCSSISRSVGAAPGAAPAQSAARTASAASFAFGDASHHVVRKYFTAPARPNRS